MLFTDSDLVATADLLALDPELMDVAAAERIVIEGEGSAIRTAWGEAHSELLSRTEPFGGAGPQFGGGDWYGAWTYRQRLYLTQVVATNRYAATQSPLQRWLTCRALVAAYRAALIRNNTDRYQSKVDTFTSEASRSWREMTRLGLPIVIQPLPAPGSLHEAASGSWGESNVAVIAAPPSGGTTVPQGTTLSNPGAGVWQVAITWVDESLYVGGAQRGNAESAPSRILSMQVAADQVLRVSIASLIPPTTGRPLGVAPNQASFTMLKATGYNVYAGPTGGPLYLQNSAPVALNSDYTLSVTPAISGHQMETGQLPDSTFTFVNVVQRT